MMFHFKPKWTACLNAAIYLLVHYRPKWTSCVLGAILLFVCSFCVLLGWCVVQSERRLAEEEWDGLMMMHVDKFFMAKFGTPLEIEPDHFIVFERQSNRELHAWRDERMDDPSALVIYKQSWIELSIINRAKDEKDWEWRGFSWVRPLKDEFGNWMVHLPANHQVALRNGCLGYLGNKYMTLRPGEIRNQILLFEKLPASSRQFTVDLKYGDSVIRLGGETGQGDY